MDHDSDSSGHANKVCLTPAFKPQLMGAPYANKKKTLERELLLKRIRELDREIAHGQCELWDLKKRQAARVPIEEQLAFYLREYWMGINVGFIYQDFAPTSRVCG